MPPTPYVELDEDTESMLDEDTQKDKYLTFALGAECFGIDVSQENGFCFRRLFWNRSSWSGTSQAFVSAIECTPNGERV